ncbi:unnamed protein product [Adineta steineri]|uniref:NAD(P)(+)--arginine ADP-ribosyltransferase n=1 Tax=Adineta steineri TaxID=433720 RepID=A0A813W759_9BILA|nr:unnamed protein product [Adineta steineri]
MATTDEANVAQYIRHMPLVSLDIAVEPLVSLISGIHIYAYSATERCKNPPANELTIDESASIMLYSMDSNKEYPVGETIVWSGFSSCTTSINFVRSELFLGSTGPRTIFSITCYFGKDIGNHSYYSSENETVIFPPTHFKVIDCLNQGNGLHIIQLQEIQPCFSHLHAPVFSSISKKPSSSE